MVWRRLVGILATTLMLLGSVGTLPAAAAEERCFAETGHCIRGAFLAYWEARGGLAVYGLPITPEQPEVNRDTGETYPTQWFERNRFELHGTQVLLGRLGDDRLRQRGEDWQTQPKGSPQANCVFYNETGHGVCDQQPGLGFHTYWISHGGLAQFGFPLTEARTETNSSGDTVQTQWFERARFEWHPNNQPTYRVLLGLLGNEVRANAGPLVRQSPREFVLTLADVPRGYQVADEKEDQKTKTFQRVFFLPQKDPTKGTAILSQGTVSASEAEASAAFEKAKASLAGQSGATVQTVGGVGDEAFLVRRAVKTQSGTIQLAAVVFRRANALGVLSISTTDAKLDANVAVRLAGVMVSRIVVK